MPDYLAHHRMLEDACRDLLAETYEDDPRALGAQWRLFEAAVESHLAEEEQQLLPSFAQDDPEEADLILSEHEKIRDLMAQLGIEVDLHAIRAHSVHALVDELHRHARHEEEVLYPRVAPAAAPERADVSHP